MKTDNLSIPPVQGQMDRHRWETVNRIFHAALELDSSSIENFVRSTSDGDTEIYAEVMALLRADEKAGSYLETPLLRENLSALFESPLKPEDVLCERFQILRAIAEGGMGHVFEALDTELNVRVALKVIRPEIASVPEALARFRQEVRLARTITHPNVCRTFDIDRETRVLEPETGSKLDLVFLTMELLPGETLASRIKRNGALPIEEAFLLACQIGDALHAAHALGIVHRDIKPSNIMLVPTESATADGKVRAVITDFGLARLNPVLPIANASSLSQTARPIGTLAYMAPEQLDGAPVSPATDIYAFGLILFEMVTGSRAFPSDNLLTGLSQRLTGPPPSPKSLAPRLPDNWCYVIDRCLQVNPSGRLQEASEVITALAGNRRLRTSGQRRFLPGTSFLFSSFRRIFAVAATTIFICLALFAGGYRLYESKADSNVTPGALVYLAPVKNETGEKSLDNVTSLIEAGLAQSVQINLLDQGRVGDILQEMTKAPDSPIDPATAREIAMRAGAARVVFATIRGSQAKYHLDIDVQQPDNTPGRYREHWPKIFTWQTQGSLIGSDGHIPPALLTTIRNASDWIRHEVGESTSDIARLDVPPEDVTTSSWDALQEYNVAERLIAESHQEQAVDSLRNAVRIDPQFAYAYGRLADVLDSLDREDEGYHAYEHALALELHGRLTRRERDRIRGMFALDTGDQQAAEEAFRDYANYYENDYDGWFFRAYPLMMLGRVPEAVETLRRAYAVDPKRKSAPDHLALCFLLLNQLPEAWKWQQWLESHGDDDDAKIVAAILDMREGRLAEAHASLNSLLTSQDPYYVSMADSLLARYYSERGEYQKAIGYTDEGIALDRSHGFTALEASKHVDRASIQCKLQPLLASEHRILEEMRSAFALRPSPTTAAAISNALDQCGTDSALPISSFASIFREMLRDLPNQPESILARTARLRLEGELLLSLGQTDGALQRLESASHLEAPTTNRLYLARGYLLAARSPSKGSERRAIDLAKAVDIYREMEKNPSITWLSWQRLPPGAYTDNLATFLRISHVSSNEQLQNVYTTFRGNRVP